MEFGVQPLLFRAPDGAPLYAPYGLEVAVPAMMIGHVLIAGPAEALVTGFAVMYLPRTNPSLLGRRGHGATPTAGPRLRWLWGAIAALALLVPIGLLATSTAWGEWNPADPLDWPLPSVPEGLRSLSGLWNAPLTGYTLHFLGDSPVEVAAAYVVSALVGVGILAAIGVVVSRLLSKRDPASSP